jgi:hypothetical protein
VCVGQMVTGELEFSGFLQALVRLALMTCSAPPSKGDEGKAKKVVGPPGPPSVCQVRLSSRRQWQGSRPTVQRPVVKYTVLGSQCSSMYRLAAVRK